MASHLDRALARYAHQGAVILDPNRPEETAQEKRWRKARTMQERYPGALVVPKKDLDAAKATMAQALDQVDTFDESDPLTLFRVVEEEGAVTVKLPVMVFARPRDAESDRQHAERILGAISQDDPFLTLRRMREYLEAEETVTRAWLAEQEASDG